MNQTEEKVEEESYYEYYSEYEKIEDQSPYTSLNVGKQKASAAKKKVESE